MNVYDSLSISHIYTKNDNELIKYNHLKNLEYAELEQYVITKSITRPEYNCGDCFNRCVTTDGTFPYICNKLKGIAIEVYTELYGKEKLMEVLL